MEFIIVNITQNDTYVVAAEAFRECNVLFESWKAKVNQKSVRSELNWEVSK